MKYAIKKEIKYFFSNLYWLLIIILYTFMGYLLINNQIHSLEQTKKSLIISSSISGNIEYLNIANSKYFINIYNVMSGIFHDAIRGMNNPMSIIVIIFLIFLSATSLSYYIYERKGYIKYQYLKISKKEFILAKVIVNTIGIGFVFIVPHIILLIYYSFFYSYNLPVINDLEMCSVISECDDAFLYTIFNYHNPITTLIINHIVRPFINGVILSLTILTFSLIAKRKSLLMVYALGFMLLYIALFALKQTLLMKLTDASFDKVYSYAFIPYIELFSNNYPLYFIPYLKSASTILIVLIILIVVVWRKQKDEI